MNDQEQGDVENIPKREILQRKFGDFSLIGSILFEQCLKLLPIRTIHKHSRKNQKIRKNQLRNLIKKLKVNQKGNKFENFRKFGKIWENSKKKNHTNFY